MEKEKGFIQKSFHYILPLLLMFSLAACNQREKITTPIHKTHPVKSLYDQVKPLSVKKSSFQKIVGWLDNNTIVYISEQKNQTFIYSYKLLNGQQQVLYTSDSPIKNVIISPDKKKLLIHSALLTNLAEVKIINLEGKALFSKKIPSFDLTFNWNKENPDLILATIFFEDWSYQVNVLNVKDHSFQKYSFSDPFVKWFKQDDILIQDWNNNEMHFFAPLLSYPSSNTNHGKSLFQNIYQFDTFQPNLMTITIPENDKDQAIYHFYNKSLEELFTFNVPHLRQYDNWLVPNYDLIKNEFLTFVPYESGPVDEYSGKFKLIKYDIHSKKKKIIVNELNNEAIIISPDGKMCLYGNQLNQLIDLNTGKMKAIVQYEKKSL